MSDEGKTRAVPYVRWQKDEPRKGREFPPVSPEHPNFNEPCRVCTRPLGDGKPIALVAIGPNSEDAWQRHQVGRWYSAQAGAFHAGCVGESVEAGEVVPKLDYAWTNWTCPRCEFPLQVPALAPWQALHIGPNGESLIFHAVCLGTDAEEPV